MIDGLKPCSAMKDSGVVWLGKVPEHWEILPNRAVFTEVKERNHPNADMLSVTITKGVIRQQALLADSSKKDSSNLDKSAYKLVRPGDIAYNKMRAWQGAIGVSEYEGIVSPAYVVQRPRVGIEPRYFHYLLRTPAFAKEAERWSYGITSDMWSLRPEHFRMINSCLPPLPEQATIVRFLDHVDRQIRRYIRAKQKLINLVEEQKHAIIHRAVTRGLDPNVRLKSSGVKWLGDVPEHWKVVRSGSMFRLFGGYAFPGTGFVKDESDPTLPLLLTPVNFDPEGGLRFGSKSTIRFQGEVPAQFVLRKGSLVTVLTDLSSKRLILGRAGFIDVDGVLLNQRTARIDVHSNCRARLSLEYLCLVLNSPPVREQTIETSRGSTVFHTSPTRMLSAQWPLPPIEEQHAIVANVSRLEREHHAVHKKLRDEIELFNEFRTRLVADVVTGKFDVRNLVAQLPDEAEETDTIAETEAETDVDEEGSGEDVEVSEEAEP